MRTYVRHIKFCYYKLVKVKITDGGKEVLDGKFNLVEWIMEMEEKDGVKHNMSLSDCEVNFEQYYKIPNRDIYILRVFKLRDINVPSKIKDGEDAQPIHLDPDEYIGEDVNFLYDRDNSVVMLQQNRMSIGVSRLCEWFNQICPIEGEKIVLLPVLNRFTTNKMGAKTVRSIDFSFANNEPTDANGSLGQIIKSFNRYKGLTGHVIISVGRDKHSELDKENVIDLINDIQTNPGIVNSAKVKLRDSVCDDDKARLEVVDIFENSLHDYIQFDIELRKPLDFELARKKMYGKYMERKSDIEKLCR